MVKKTKKIEIEDENSILVEDKKQSSFAKGKNLEEDFAKFMERELGFKKTFVRRKVRSATNITNIEIDVIGFKTDPRGKKLNLLGFVYFSIGILIFVTKAYYTFSFENQIDSSSSIILFIFAIFLIVAGSVVFFKSKNFESENAWVECKDLKNKVDIDTVTTMFSRYEGHDKSGDKTYKFTELYFVSANGFIDNALQYAESKNIKCYVKDQGGKFQKI